MNSLLKYDKLYRILPTGIKQGEKMSKLTLCVLFGGASSEHDISCISAKSILKNIDKEKYNIVKLGITRQGEWFLFDDDVNMLPNDEWLKSASLKKAYITPDSKIHGIVTEDGEQIKLDVVFPVLHGKNGEDGTVQGLLQLAQIPFVGCDATSSGSCMDKAVTNAVADAFGIEQAKWCAFTKYEYGKDSRKCLDLAISKLGFPIFVKPANAGSSVGITKAHNEEKLIVGIEKAFKEDKKVVLEEFIEGQEVEVAVLGNEEPVAAEVGQIVAAAEFYDFDAKYNNPASELHIPALLNEEKRNEVRQAALRAYKALSCEGMSRCDFFVTKAGKRVLLNEINTIPGQTSISMYPKLFEAVGVGYTELIDRLIDLAIKRGGII